MGRVIEYGGEGVQTLSVPERATITNMGAELGATTSIFPSDQVTRAFLKAQGREQDWTGLAPDADAEYERVVPIALDALAPLIACPHSPDNVRPVEELQDIRVDQGRHRELHHSSYADLMKVAGIPAGKTAHKDVSLVKGGRGPSRCTPCWHKTARWPTLFRGRADTRIGLRTLHRHGQGALLGRCPSARSTATSWARSGTKKRAGLPRQPRNGGRDRAERAYH